MVIDCLKQGKLLKIISIRKNKRADQWASLFQSKLQFYKLFSALFRKRSIFGPGKNENKSQAAVIKVWSAWISNGPSGIATKSKAY